MFAGSDSIDDNLVPRLEAKSTDLDVEGAATLFAFPKALGRVARDNWDGAHERPAAPVDADQAFTAQQSDCTVDGDPRDAELARQFRLARKWSARRIDVPLDAIP